MYILVLSTLVPRPGVLCARVAPMKIFDRIRDWLGASDEEKVMMDRRAFLKGMTVTSAGLLVPGVTIFDVGRGAPPLADGLLPDYVRNPCGEILLKDAQKCVLPIKPRRVVFPLFEVASNPEIPLAEIAKRRFVPQPMKMPPGLTHYLNETSGETSKARPSTVRRHRPHIMVTKRY